jgi:hypothetical protein
MNNYSIILPIIIAATLGASALYLSSGNEEDKALYNNPNQDQYSYSPQPMRFNPTNSNSNDSGSGPEAYIGGLTKRHKNKHMKKKSKSRRSKKSKK